MFDATLPDLLRLVAVPVLGWAAYRDVQVRRVPNRLWYPLAALGVVLLAYEAWDLGLLTGGPLAPGGQFFLLRVAISLGVVVPFAYGVWRVGGFGGADAKAVMVFAVLFPTAPAYYVPALHLGVPLETGIGVFSLTVLSNTVVLAAAYPLVLTLRNAVRGDLSRLMFVGTRVDSASVVERHGRLLETPDGPTRRGLDVDALRMYLRWRDATLADLRADPARFRDPTSLPDERGDPGDGAIADGGVPVPPEEAADDPWGAAAFLAEVPHAWGTDAETLRGGLEVLAGQDRVWYSPGIPFIVPMFAGLVVALVFGDLLFAGMLALGLV